MSASTSVYLHLQEPHKQTPSSEQQAQHSRDNKLPQEDLDSAGGCWAEAEMFYEQQQSEQGSDRLNRPQHCKVGPQPVL